MSFRLVIMCDQPGCRKEYFCSARSVKVTEHGMKEARRKARRLGWKEKDDKDYCPECAKKHST